ncbi:MAG: Rne/Rng family ribonuclease [Proteobacteria bacterium]|nr:Rne/Rng family ribonuclease [Pseudomonadota bacterium]
MYKKIVVNVCEHETRVALLEDGTIAEFFIERGNISDIAGNIYKGRVQRVLPGMQAAFIDIGINQAAFIYVDDLNVNSFDELNPFNSDELQTEDNANLHHESAHPFKKNHDIKIGDLITEGQEVLAQVAKPPIGTKGARATSYATLPGRFLVLMPNSDHIGISRRIENETERTRLKEMVISLRKDHFGYIVRTAAEGIQEESLLNEMSFLINIWKNVQEKYQKTSAPSLLHKELTVCLRAARDLLMHEAEKMIIDSRPDYESVLSFLDTFMPSLKSSVELYEGHEPIFDAYNLEGDISRAIRRKIWLKSGGYIVIEHTEALVAIDVNTGRYVGKHNLEETILKTNLEAVKEIAYQIRLRDIGGIIIIDFIDMEKKQNQEKVFNAFKEALSKDKSKTNILPISEMGLIQMTRKRIRSPLIQALSEPCFYCEGEGKLLSKQTICYNIYREIQRESLDMAGSKVALHVHPEIAELLHVEESHLISSLEKMIGRQIVIYPEHEYHLQEFEIVEIL